MEVEVVSLAGWFGWLVWLADSSAYIVRLYLPALLCHVTPNRATVEADRIGPATGFKSDAL